MATWDPFREMDSLRREMERLFDTYGGERRPATRRAAFLPGYAARQYPLVNLYEDNDNVYVEALAPGVDAESLNLSVQGNVLTISGEKLASNSIPAESYHRSERSAGKFIRTVEVPTATQSDMITAAYRNGLLLVTLPKQEEAKPKQIQVKIG